MTGPGPVVLAEHLVAAGVPLVVVGGAARWLRAPARAPIPRDLDVLLPPTNDAVAALLASLPGVEGWSRTRRPRGGAELAEYEPWQLMTAFGGLDVFVLHRPALSVATVVHDGVGLPVQVRSCPVPRIRSRSPLSRSAICSQTSGTQF